jgi:hypothetical protein
MSIKMKVFGAALAVALVTAAVAGPAYADEHSNNTTPGFTITGGTGPRFDTDVPTAGIYPTVNDFGDVALNGTPQLTSATIPPFTIIDDSGDGAGWNVVFKLPNFADTHSNGHIVSATGASMNAPVLRAGTEDSALGGVYTRSDVNFTGAGKVIVRADPGNWAANPAVGADLVDHGNGDAPLGADGVTHVAGMGTYLISPQIVKLVVADNAIADDYQTTANFTITAGP